MNRVESDNKQLFVVAKISFEVCCVNLCGCQDFFFICRLLVNLTTSLFIIYQKSFKIDSKLSN
jgi:hypothetical protein